MSKLIGRGVYTLAEAERLVCIPAKRIARWTRGYSFRSRGKARYSPPLIAVDGDVSVSVPSLSFADILEIRFLDAFLQHGVSLNAIRIATVRAREFLGRTHPFSTSKFKTDGRTILAEVVKGSADPILVDLVRDQYEFQRIVSPLLYAGIDFDEFSEPSRWWPVGKKRKIVVDPLRAFGAPISSEAAIPTRVLSDAVKANESVGFVAACYHVSAKAVRDAVYFEQRLRA